MSKRNRQGCAAALCLYLFLMSGTSAQAGIEVSGILSGEEPAAIVNGKVVGKGDTLEGFRVVKIAEDHVVFLSPEGKQVSVRLRSFNAEESLEQEQAVPEEKKQGFWERLTAFFSPKKDKKAKQPDAPKKMNPVQAYFSRAGNAKRRAEQVMSEQRRRVQEAEAEGGGGGRSFDVSSAANTRYIDGRIMEAQHILRQADSLRRGKTITAQFFQEKISLYDDAERKLQDALSRTLDIQKQTNIKEVLRDIREKRSLLYREKKNFHKQIQRAIQAKKILIGMTKLNVKNALGMPDEVSKESYKSDLLDLWTYAGELGHPAAKIYFRDDIVVSVFSR